MDDAKEITIRFIWENHVIFENHDIYEENVDAEEDVEEFIRRVNWTFGYEYDLDWDWKADDRIDIWVKG